MKVHSNRPETISHSIIIGGGIKDEVMGRILVVWNVRYSSGVIMGGEPTSQIIFFDVTDEFVSFVDALIEEYDEKYQYLSRRELIKMINK